MPSVEEFMAIVFTGCISLVSINLPSAKYFRNENFFMCENLERIELPSLVSLGGNNFRGCFNLKEVIIGENYQGHSDVYFSFSEFGGDPLEVNYYCLEPISTTENIILTLGEFVLPKADTIFNT